MGINMHEADWISTGGDYVKGLPRLAFPLESGVPDLYAPQSTILLTSDGTQTHAYLWCYLEREVFGRRYKFNPSSLSAQRVKALPRVIERLSARFRFDNARPRSVSDELANGMSRFLTWLDAPLHHGRYESVLNDPDLALVALRKHHSYLRQRMQANDIGKRISASSASMLDVDSIKMMSVIHDREYSNEIEAIKYIHGEGVKVPKTEDVAAFMACLQGVFDSVAQIVLNDVRDNKDRAFFGELRWQCQAQQVSVPIPVDLHIERLIELGCVAYAALCIADSGANLAPIQSYEEPQDLHEQLNNPNRLSLRHKVIKFRAGGKAVPVHLTSTTVTRMRTYLQLREALRQRLDYPEIDPMFILCKYPGSSQRRPEGIMPLPPNFTATLRGRFAAFGIKLPLVTMQQLRAYKSGKVAKEHSLKVAADMMGHSVSTAIRKYSNITAAESRAEMAPFLLSLTSVVLKRSEAGVDSPKSVIPIASIPAGGCEDLGHPEALTDHPLVTPDCKKTEGCFFCSKFHVHAEEDDCVKLMSCRSVLERLAPRLGGQGAADLVYTVVVDRIDALLSEIQRIAPEAYTRARVAVHEQGRLSRYWASKLQQLHLLGLLARPSALV